VVAVPPLTELVRFKLQLVTFFEGIRAARQLMRHAADRLSLRSFLGYDLQEPLASSFQSNQDPHMLWD
jgi:hypothetical protein